MSVKNNCSILKGLLCVCVCIKKVRPLLDVWPPAMALMAYWLGCPHWIQQYVGWIEFASWIMVHMVPLIIYFWSCFKCQSLWALHSANTYFWRILERTWECLQFQVISVPIDICNLDGLFFRVDYYKDIVIQHFN